MQYLGGKRRIAGKVADVLREHIGGHDLYLEPFVGGAAILEAMADFKGRRVASDIHPDLIELHRAVRDGWLPPRTMSREEYNALKDAPPSALRAAAGFGMTFSGKWFGGYAVSKRGRDFAGAFYKSRAKAAPLLAGVEFLLCDYWEHRPTNALIYCDPPYSDTTGYSVGAWDALRFWEAAREWASRGNTVLVSEYAAPADFECVAEIPRRLGMNTGDKSQEIRIERIFRPRL